MVRYFLFLFIRFEISFGCEDLVSSLVFLKTSFIASALKASFAGRIFAIERKRNKARVFHTNDKEGAKKILRGHTTMAGE